MSDVAASTTSDSTGSSAVALPGSHSQKDCRCCRLLLAAERQAVVHWQLMALFRGCHWSILLKKLGLHLGAALLGALGVTGSGSSVLGRFRL